MAPLAHTLALLAMAVATVAIKVVPLDMAQDSFDDQYLKCRDKMSEKFRELQDSDFLEKEFKENWTKATDKLQKRGSISSSLTQDEAIALMAYTMKGMNLYKQFNDAVREAGSSSWKYQNEFHFKSLHFLLTQALQKLRRPNDCQVVYRGVSRYQYKVNKDDEVRFGQFASTSLRKKVAQRFGQDTMFKVHTCHGVDIQKFSMYPEEQEVLIPPFEAFKVIAVSKPWRTMYIELHSTRNCSNYDCEWLKDDTIEKTIMGTNVMGKTIMRTTSWEDQGHAVTGGTLSRNSLHLGGLLLATLAMAVVTGTL